ncbi:helix-turn-helix domain-containing protein [Microvirga aerophila]|uniref:Uncharacterized protein n=1 Tax=Microvirga aerophila TaxID=670291 RepID=A0A512C3Z7_9HYPH|nr:helix-turn-helix domain-containing protein [Microvirga aerophila]GEO18939.1 hypothetical protein MAE02_66350 [Microvirga aerophila]
MLKRYHVDLTRKERTDLLGLLNKGIAPARMLTRARILLAADERKTDAEIAASLHVHPATVERTRLSTRSSRPLRRGVCEAAGVPLQVQTRELAQHGGTGVGGAPSPMPGPASPRPGYAATGDCRVGGRARQD